MDTHPDGPMASTAALRRAIIVWRGRRGVVRAGEMGVGGVSVKRVVWPPVARERRRWWIVEMRSVRVREARRDVVVVWWGCALSLRRQEFTPVKMVWMDAVEDEDDAWESSVVELAATSSPFVRAFGDSSSSVEITLERARVRKIFNAWESSSALNAAAGP